MTDPTHPVDLSALHQPMRSRTLLISLAGFLGFTLVVGVLMYSITTLTQQSQDIRQKAAEIASGVLVKFTIEGEKLLLKQSSSIKISANSPSKVNKIELDFLLSTTAQTLASLQIQVNPDSGFIQEGLNVTDETGAKRVRAVFASSAGAAGSTIDPAVELMRLNLVPSATDVINVTLDNTTSNAYVAGSSADQLVAIAAPIKFPVAASATTPAVTENLFFTADNKLEFFKESNNASVKLTDLVSGERYKVKHSAQLQNVVKNAESTDARSLTVGFKANDSGSIFKNLALSQLQKTPGGVNLEFETTFVGRTNNEFVTTADTANTIVEANENDNVLRTTYNYTVASTTVAPSTIATVCNQYCANDGECGYGLKCWYNKCRHPDNLESERCVAPASTVPGCNLKCENNRDCGAGLFCTNKLCRNPQAPASATCQIVAATPASTTTPAAAKGQMGATGSKDSTPAGILRPPSPTPQPTPESTATPRPTANPQPAKTTPSPAPTVMGDIMGWFNQLSEQIFTTLKLPVAADYQPWIVGAVAALVAILIAALIQFVRARGNKLPPLPPRTASGTPANLDSVPVRPVQNPLTSQPVPGTTSTYGQPPVQPPVQPSSSQTGMTAPKHTPPATTQPSSSTASTAAPEPAALPKPLAAPAATSPAIMLSVATPPTSPGVIQSNTVTASPAQTPVQTGLPKPVTTTPIASTPATPTPAPIPIARTSPKPAAAAPTTPANPPAAPSTMIARLQARGVIQVAPAAAPIHTNTVNAANALDATNTTSAPTTAQTSSHTNALNSTNTTNTAIARTNTTNIPNTTIARTGTDQPIFPSPPATSLPATSLPATPPAS